MNRMAALRLSKLSISTSAKTHQASSPASAAHGGFLRTFQPDLIHSHNFHGNMLARLVRVFHPRVRLISTIHNVYEGGPLRMLAYRATDPLAHRTTAVSAAVAERYVRLKAVPPAKCVVLTNGIDAAEFQPDADRRASMRAQMGITSEFIWLTVGRITAAKGLPNLLQAFAEVSHSGIQTQLWIAGETPGGNSGKSDSTAVGMPVGAIDNVRRLGLRRDIPALLDAADGFVLSSAWEGMPLALGEAMAMEKTVVATDVGGVRELLGDAGVLAPAKDPSALARAMLEGMRRSVLSRLLRIQLTCTPAQSQFGVLQPAHSPWTATSGLSPVHWRHASSGSPRGD